MTRRGVVADFRPWSEQEDARIRAVGYRRGNAAKLAAELGRTVLAVRKRARRLGFAAARKWSADEEQLLRSLWGEQSLARIAKAVNHTRQACYQRANELGIIGTPEGFETLTKAGERTGYDTSQLWMILRWAGVEIHARTTRSKTPGHRFHHVDPFDVDEAIAKWLKTEPLETAAERHGVCGEALRQWLRWAKACGFNVPPEPKQPKVHWRVPSELADQVVAWRSGFESVAQAAKRTGIHHQRLNRMLVDAGVRRFSVKPWLVLPAEVDRVIAEAAGRKAA